MDETSTLSTAISTFTDRTSSLAASSLSWVALKIRQPWNLI